MFGIGGPELIVILVVALLVFGPKRLPDLARSLGKGLAEFRKASNDLRRSIELEAGPDKPEPKPAGASAPAPASLEKTHSPASGDSAPPAPKPSDGAKTQAPEPARPSAGPNGD